MSRSDTGNQLDARAAGIFMNSGWPSAQTIWPIKTKEYDPADVSDTRHSVPMMRKKVPATVRRPPSRIVPRLPIPLADRMAIIVPGR